MWQIRQNKGPHAASGPPYFHQTSCSCLPCSPKLRLRSWDSLHPNSDFNPALNILTRNSRPTPKYSHRLHSFAIIVAKYHKRVSSQHWGGDQIFKSVQGCCALKRSSLAFCSGRLLLCWWPTLQLRLPLH